MLKILDVKIDACNTNAHHLIVHATKQTVKRFEDYHMLHVFTLIGQLWDTDGEWEECDEGDISIVFRAISLQDRFLIEIAKIKAYDDTWRY